MATYNLNDNVKESFEFEVGGHTYSMRYPIMDELTDIQEQYGESNRLRIEAKANPELLKQADDTDKAIEEKLYSYITPVSPDSPSITETMKHQNVRVMRNFRTMFQTEFGLGG